jgi:HK97 family phage prohead protease
MKKNLRNSAEIEFKTYAMEVKDVDTKSGIVCGYFAGFDNIDNGYDMIVRGAFKKTIAERGPNGSKQIKHLLQHDSWSPPIGFIQVLKEDDIGLYFESKMSAIPKAQDVLTQYAEGIYNEHSIGYRVMKEETVEDENGNFVCWKLTEVKLWEGSTVTWGMNDQTPFVGFKSEKKTERIAELSKRMQKCIAALKIGNLSDDTYEQLEIELLKLDEAYKSLIITDEPERATRQPKKDDIGHLKKLSEIFNTNE